MALEKRLKLGDRVVVTVGSLPDRPLIYHGVITGESRTGHAWMVLRDEGKWPHIIHKRFCQPENDG